MPYIDKTSIESVETALELWRGVMDDPNIDGFNGFGCKQKIYRALWAAEKALAGSTTYHGEKEWIENNRR